MASLQEKLDACLNDFKSAIKSKKSKNIQSADYFARVGIRTKGTKEEPLFCLADIAKIIDDKDYENYTTTPMTDMEMKDADNHTRSYKMLFDIEVYEYLMSHKTLNTKPFQLWFLQMIELSRTIDGVEKNNLDIMDMLTRHGQTQANIDTDFPSSLFAVIKNVRLTEQKL